MLTKTLSEMVEEIKTNTKIKYVTYGLNGTIAEAETAEEFIEKMGKAGYMHSGFFKRVSTKQSERLEGQPKFTRMLGPFVNGSEIRYETQRLYNLLGV
jgi:lipid II:glycine glycyltransferase (peptidoglycan interpeptide bridge formation enzyme)